MRLPKQMLKKAILTTMLTTCCFTTALANNITMDVQDGEVRDVQYLQLQC